MISHGHNAENWVKNYWEYYPINYHPNKYYELTKWWLDLVPKYGSKIMEVGAWSGLASIWLKMNFPQMDVVVVDINPYICHFLRTRFYHLLLIDKISVYCEDSFDLKGYGDKSKDVIFSDGLVEHFDEEDRVKLLKEQLRVAKYVICVIPMTKALLKGGGYGDERQMDYKQWCDFMSKYFKIVNKDSYFDIYEVYVENDCAAFVLEGVKDE